MIASLTRLLAVSLVLALTLAATPAGAAKRLALLVGVAGYEHWPALKGPPNDVRLMWRLLQDQLGFAESDITVLADRLEAKPNWPKASGSPTKSAILDAIARLAADATDPNDFVVIYISGHGAYARNDNEASDPEPDGVDEFFLPLDARPFDQATGEMANAIRDDEFATAFAAFGSNLWLIFDSCFSGDLTRGNARSRFVSPAQLGLPPEMSQRRTVGARGPAAAPVMIGDDRQWVPLTAAGRLIAFSAVSSEKQAIEKPIPARGGEVYGVFTHLLADVLDRHAPANYRQLADLLGDAYDAFDARMHRPLFEGDLDRLLDLSVRGWTVRVSAGKVEVLAGWLHGIGEGSILAVGLADGGKGYLRIERASPLRSWAVPIAFGMSAKPVDLGALEGRILNATVQQRISFSLRVARPAGAGPSPERQRALDAIARIEADGASADALPVTWVSPASDADFWLHVNEGRIIVLPRQGELKVDPRRPPPQLPIDATVEETATGLRSVLWGLLRQRNLLDIAARMRPGDWASELDIDVRIERGKPSRGEADESHACPVKRRRPRFEDLPKFQHEKVTHCDTLHVRIAYTGKKRIDITCLYLEADGAIQAFPPEGASQHNAAATSCYPVKWDPAMTRKRAVEGVIVHTALDKGRRPLSLGLERLIVIAVQRDSKKGYPISFRYLAQRSLARTTESIDRQIKARGPEDTRTPAGALRKLMHGAVGGTRGSADLDLDNVVMRVLRWDIVSPQEFTAGSSAK